MKRTALLLASTLTVALAVARDEPKPLTEEAKATGKFKVVSVARLLAEAIRRIHHSDSVSSLFI